MSSFISRRTVIAGGLATAAALTLAACSKSGKGEVKGIKVDGDTATITIGATPKPHVEILKWVQDNLTKGSGIKLDIKEINDYQTPNSSLEDGSLAANFYQTPNFLAQQNKEKGYDFVSIADVHIEPMGIYTSKGYKDVKDIKEGGTIVLNNDPANTARGLKLLAQAGLIELDKSAELPSDTDVTSNPKKLKFTTVDGAQVYKSMPDAEAAVINGNYAITPRRTRSSWRRAARIPSTPTSSSCVRTTRTTSTSRSSPSSSTTTSCVTTSTRPGPTGRSSRRSDVGRLRLRAG